MGETQGPYIRNYSLRLGNTSGHRSVGRSREPDVGQLAHHTHRRRGHLPRPCRCHHLQEFINKHRSATIGLHQSGHSFSEYATPAAGPVTEETPRMQHQADALIPNRQVSEFASVMAMYAPRHFVARRTARRQGRRHSHDLDIVCPTPNTQYSNR